MTTSSDSLSREPQVSGQRGRVEIEVGVDERDERAARGEHAGPHGVALAEIPVVVDDARELRVAFDDALLAAIARAVRDDDQLDLLAERFLDATPDRAYVVADRVGEVERRDDDAE